MIPLRDSAAPRRFTLVNCVLIAINLGVFGYEVSLGSRVAVLMERFALVPRALTSWLQTMVVGERPVWSLHAPLTVVTAMFLHAGVLHVLGNMLYLFVFGAAVEGRLGARRYAGFYLAAGIAAALATVAFAPQSTVPVIGASGAIAGVLGAYFVMYPRGRILTVLPLFVFLYTLEVPAVLYLLLWFALQLFSGLSEGRAGVMSGGVAWWAHVGGFLFGAALGPLLARKPGPRGKRRQRLSIRYGQNS